MHRRNGFHERPVDEHLGQGSVGRVPSTLVAVHGDEPYDSGTGAMRANSRGATFDGGEP